MLLYLSQNGTVKCSQLYGCVDYRYLNKFTSGESATDSRKFGSLSSGKKRNGGKINIFSRKVHQKSGKMDQRSPAGPFFGADTKKNREHIAVFCGERGIRTPGTVTGTTV